MYINVCTVLYGIIIAWLSVCRVTGIISLVLLVISLMLFILLVVCGVAGCCLSCPAVIHTTDELCQRVLLYATPITCILAGKVGCVLI